MRGGGISGAGMDADLGGMEDEDASVPSEDGGEATPPDTTTGTDLGGDTPTTDQTV